MHILLIQNGERINQYRFRRGPIYIGRQLGSQVFLPDRAVSRQHAVIFNTPDNKWYIEDLDSPNKTYLNKKAVHKSPLENGDSIKIGSFTLEIGFGEDANREVSMHLEDTLADEHSQMQSISRRVDRDDSPIVRISTKKLASIEDFTNLLLKDYTRDDFFRDVVRFLIKQLTAANVWLAIVDPTAFSIKYQYGKKISTEKIEFNDLVLKDKVLEALKTGTNFLIPKVPVESRARIKSSIIVPIVSNKKKVGIIYIDNSKEHEQYSMQDLDCVILLSKLMAAKITSFT